MNLKLFRETYITESPNDYASVPVAELLLLLNLADGVEKYLGVEERGEAEFMDLCMAFMDLCMDFKELEK